MTWGGRRKLLYGGILCIIVALGLLAYIYPKINVAPTCIDQKQNGAEHGIDCGGICVKICQAEAAPLVVKWTRSFKVADGFYNAFSYVENQNIQAAAQTLYYEFSLYDSDNVFITSRTGTTYIPPNGRFGIFEPAISTGKRIPKNTSIKLVNDPQWLKVSQDEAKQSIFTEASVPTNLEIAPKLSVLIENPTITPVKNIDVFAIIYGEAGNALGVSKTVIDTIAPNSKRTATFTWRQPFAGEVKKTEIISQVNVFVNR